MDGIVTIQLRGLEARLADRKIHLDLAPEARTWLADRGYDPVYGARPLKRVIQKALQDPLAERLLAGPVVRAPALRRSGVVVSLRGGDFELALGRDISLGYVSHDASSVRLCLLESLALQRADTDAAVALGGKTLSGRRSRPEEVVLSAS